MELTTSQLDSWRTDGWLALRGAIEPELVDRLSAAADELAVWAETNGPGLHHFEQTEAGAVIARSERFADDHTMLREFLTTGLIPAVLRQLFGQDPSLFKEKINYKHPGGGGFAPHQDATAYRFVDHHISVMVPIDPATIESGCLYFAPGHARGHLEVDDRGRITESVAASLDWQPVEVEPGDLVVFDSYAPHYSDTNHSDRSRRVYYLTYNDAAHGDLRTRYYADKDAEFERHGETFGGERVRISISDDFLGKPVTER